MEYRPSDPDKTLPTPTATDTQRFRPVKLEEATLPPVAASDDNQTNPHFRVEKFSEHPVANAEKPPKVELHAIPRVGETWEYEGSLKVVVKEIEEGKGYVAEDENGIRFFITDEEWRSKGFKPIRE